jgi:hypothetical protein
MSKNMKNNSKILFKTTSALTCLIGAVLLFNQTAANALVTTAGTMSVTTTVGAVCSISATELAFGAYPNTNVVANSTAGGGIVSTNCSSALSHILKVTEVSSSGAYNLAKSGGSATANQLISFRLYTASAAGGTNLSEAIAFVTATGVGASAAVATLFGQIELGNTLKESGSYTKSIALSATYSE